MIISEIFDIFAEEVNDLDTVNPQFSTVQRKIMLDEAYFYLFAEAKKMNKDYGIQWIDVNTSTDFRQDQDIRYWVPPVENSQITHIQKFLPDGGSSLFPMSVATKDFAWNRPNAFNFRTHDGWFFLGNNIAVHDNIPANDLRVYYVRRWPLLHSGAFKGTSTANTAFLDEAAANLIGTVIRQKGYYKFGRIQTVSGAGDVAGQIRTIIDYDPYDAGGPKITVDTDWDNQPVAADTYSLIPEFPEEHQPVLGMRMAMMAMRRRGNAKQFAVVTAPYRERMDTYRSSMKQRQDQEARGVVDTEETYY